MMKHVKPSSQSTKQKGAAAIEMAIVLPLLVLIFTGMIEYGRLMWHYDALAKATRDAARFLSKEQTIGNTEKGTARTMVGNAASAAGIKDLNTADGGDIAITCNPANCVSPDTVTVSIRYGFTIGGWVPVIGPLSTSIFEVNLTPHTTMRYML